MKTRYISLLLFAASVSLLLCFACAKPPLPKGDKEIAENSRLYSRGSFAVRHEDKLYFYEHGADTGVAYSVDINTGETFPLCGKPECLHNDKNCNGHLTDANGLPFLMVYNERLYWIGWNAPDFTLYSMSLDATDKRVEFPLNKEYEALAINGFAGIYDGVLYRWGSGETVSGGEIKSGTLFYSQSLEKGSEPRVIFQSEEGDKIVARMDGHMIYCASFFNQEDEARMQLRAYDMETDELRELYNGDGMFGARDMFVKDGQLIFNGGDAVSYSLETGELKKLYNGEAVVYATDDCIIEQSFSGGIKCYDHSGNLLCTAPFEAEGLDTNGVGIVGFGSIDGVFFYSLKPIELEKRAYLVSFNTKTAEVKLLWSLSDWVK